MLIENWNVCVLYIRYNSNQIKWKRGIYPTLKSRAFSCGHFVGKYLVGEVH